MVSRNDRQDIQRPLADRAVLQGAQTAAQGKELCGHLTERPAVPSLGCIDRLFAPELFEV